MKVLLLSRYDRLGASSRVRSHQYIPMLAASGFDVTVAPLFGSDYLRRLYSDRPKSWSSILGNYLRQSLRVLASYRFDLVWIEKEIFPGIPGWFELALSARGIPYIVDYDDAVFHRYDLSTNPVTRLLRQKIDKIMQRAAVVICGNSYLADRARNANSRRVEVVPSVVDLSKYTVRAEASREYVVVGWIGSPSTAPYLELVVPALRTLSEDLNVRIRLVGGEFRATGLEIECRPWSEDSEVREIQDFDIGLMPLFDTPWERGKCGYKLIQYMACGVPAVASAVGMNSEIISTGKNGLLAQKPADWLSAIRALCLDAGLRGQLGAEGRRTVENKYSLQVTAPRFVNIFQQALTSTLA
jgi:glycosyltransferase involved in cell wall biosynthesis